VEWKDLWGVEIEGSKSVALRISVSESEDTATKILSIRKWIRRGTESHPTKDIRALEAAREYVSESE
jgi:hypothetical protein